MSNGNVAQRKIWWRHWSVVFILAVLAALVIWSMLNLGPWLRAWQEQRAASAAQRQLEKTYREDKYGGKTPEETFDMFIAALEKGDVDLASKYFVLNKQEQWLKSLQKVEEQNLLIDMVKELKFARTNSTTNINGTIARISYSIEIKETEWLDMPDGTKSEFPPGKYGAEIIMEEMFGKWKVSKL